GDGDVLADGLDLALVDQDDAAVNRRAGDGQDAPALDRQPLLRGERGGDQDQDEYMAKIVHGHGSSAWITPSIMVQRTVEVRSSGSPLRARRSASRRGAMVPSRPSSPRSLAGAAVIAARAASRGRPKRAASRAWSSSLPPVRAIGMPASCRVPARFRTVS